VKWNLQTHEPVWRADVLAGDGPSGTFVHVVEIGESAHAVLIGGSWSGELCLFSLESGQELRCFTGHPSAVWTAAFSPDGTKIASGRFDRQVLVWDVATGEVLQQFTFGLGDQNVVVGIILARTATAGCRNA
jgi:WD40 repeat protein